MDTKIRILEFAKKNKLCVLSTSVDNQPESALVDFAINDDLELIFNTYTTSRKYKNLQVNPRISIVTGFGETLESLQYEGIARELDGHDEGEVMAKHRETLEFFRRWKIDDMKYFKVQPTLIKLSDFSQFPPKILEIKF